MVASHWSSAFFKGAQRTTVGFLFSMGGSMRPFAKPTFFDQRPAHVALSIAMPRNNHLPSLNMGQRGGPVSYYAERRYTCRACQKTKPVEQFSKSQLQRNKQKITCIACTPKQNTAMTCVLCCKTMPLEAFTKAQRKCTGTSTMAAVVAAARVNQGHGERMNDSLTVT